MSARTIQERHRQYRNGAEVSAWVRELRKSNQTTGVKEMPADDVLNALRNIGIEVFLITRVDEESRGGSVVGYRELRKAADAAHTAGRPSRPFYLTGRPSGKLPDFVILTEREFDLFHGMIPDGRAMVLYKSVHGFSQMLVMP